MTRTDPDVRAYFVDAESINRTLRALVRLVSQPSDDAVENISKVWFDRGRCHNREQSKIPHTAG